MRSSTTTIRPPLSSASYANSEVGRAAILRYRPIPMGGLDDMPDYKNLTVGICAAGLALGLAACGGGGGGGGAAPNPAAMDRGAVLATALVAASGTGADGTFDDTPYGVAPSFTASHDGAAVTIGVTETGTPRGGSARSGEFVEREPRPAAVAGWTRARFRRGETDEHLVVHTDVAAPEAMAFTPENLNRLKEVSGLTGDTVPASGLAVLAGWLPVVRATSLAAAPPNGSITYSAQGSGANAGLEFAGTFGGGSGTYRCSGIACSATLDDQSMPTAMGGVWAFVPDSGAMVQVPDHDHLYFGWWLDESDDGAYGFQTFADAVGFPAGAGDVAAAMEGSATYRGAAAGVWATVDSARGRVTSARSGEFTAEAVLTANFFGALDAGAVNGEIRSFRDGSGRRLDGWRVTLNAAKLTAGAASFAGETSGAVGPDTNGAGRWEGRFHGSDGTGADARPSHVTGRFDLHFPGAHVAGAFGGSR